MTKPKAVEKQRSTDGFSALFSSGTDQQQQKQQPQQQKQQPQQQKQQPQQLQQQHQVQQQKPEEPKPEPVKSALPTAAPQVNSYYDIRYIFLVIFFLIFVIKSFGLKVTKKIKDFFLFNLLFKSLIQRRSSVFIFLLISRQLMF